ncbi:hypothetical protein KR032_003748 [Drosophila birchii]|nr:hypothetical protein KR032_003748 [Drosophila birchii]
MKMNSSPAYRSVVLDCLRENARNMREDHRDLARRISIALEHSRANLLNIEKINLELQKMKVTVNDTMKNIHGTTNTEYAKDECKNLLSNLINAAVESHVIMGSIPINQIKEADIKKSPTNVLGQTVSFKVVSFEDFFDADMSPTEANPTDATYNSQGVIPKLKFESEEEIE